MKILVIKKEGVRMEKKRSKGVTIFAILILVSILYNMLGFNQTHFRTLFQPLPEKIIAIRYFLSIAVLITAFISAIGLFFLKNTFRRIIIFTAFYTVYTYLVEAPFFVFRNVHGFIKQQALETVTQIPEAPEAFIT